MRRFALIMTFASVWVRAWTDDKERERFINELDAEQDGGVGPAHSCPGGGWGMSWDRSACGKFVNAVCDQSKATTGDTEGTGGFLASYGVAEKPRFYRGDAEAS